MARKYADDMTDHMNAAIKLVFDKNPPSHLPKTLKDMTGSIEEEPQLETIKQE